MNKFFDNENGTVANLIAALMFSLIFSSVVIAYFVTESGINEKIDGVTMPDSLKSYSSNMNFSYDGCTQLDTLTRSGSSEWSCYSPVGLVLVKSSLGSGSITKDGSYMYVMNINPDSNHDVINTYVVNNSILKDWGIVIRGNSGETNNELHIRGDGIHLAYYNVLGTYQGDNDFFPYPNANRVPSVTIKTTYHEGYKTCPLFSTCQIKDQSTLKVEFNGQTYTTTKLNMPENRNLGTQMYAGVFGCDTGLNLKSFVTGNAIQGSGEAKDALSQITSFVMTILSVLTWGLPESVFPAVLNILLIKTQEVALLAAIVALIRGNV